MQQQLSLAAVLLQMGARCGAGVLQPGCVVVSGLLEFTSPSSPPHNLSRVIVHTPPPGFFGCAQRYAALLAHYGIEPCNTQLPQSDRHPLPPHCCALYEGTVLQAIQLGAFSAERSAGTHPQLLALLFTALEVALGMEYLHSQVGHVLAPSVGASAGDLFVLTGHGVPALAGGCAGQGIQPPRPPWWGLLDGCGCTCAYLPACWRLLGPRSRG